MSIPKELYMMKFAEFMESVKILYLVDDKFRTICDEYCNNKAKTEKFKKKFEKYFYQKLQAENLSKEFEEEILLYVLRRV